MLPAAVIGAWIAIAISGTRPSNEERDELLLACSEAIAGRCTLSSDGGQRGGDAPDALAVITVESNASRARAELGRTGSAWKKRELTFAEADSPKERWRALGLTLATLFGDPPAAPSPSSPAPREETARSSALDGESASVPGVIQRDTAAAMRLGAGLTTSPALTQGPLRWGALIRGSLGPFVSVLEPTLLAGYAFRPGSSRGLNARFVTLSAGLAVPYSPAGLFVLRFRLEAAAEWILVSQSAPSDSGSRLVAGTLFGLEAAWPARSRLAGFAGGEFGMFTGATAINAGGEKVASVPSRRWATSAGVLLELD